VEHKPAFAVWLTGLPASGKSTIARALKALLADRGVNVAVLESDELRKVFVTDRPYSPEGREAFYSKVSFIGSLLVEHGVPVIFDATANRRVYRERARSQIARFVEVFVDVPIEICMARDPKGIYQGGLAGETTGVPGLQDPYEQPAGPELVVHGDNPDSDAEAIVNKLVAMGYV
jgi:adenylylsulfate kinase